MALDVNKLRQQEQVQATGNNPAASASAPANNQPIDMTSDAMTAEEKRQKEIEFINSAEFKNCPDEDKAELLKQQFPYLSELSKEDFNKYLTEIITIATTKAEETETSVTDKTSQNEVDNSSELEQLALEYAKQNGLEEDIDTIINHILTAGDETENAQKILELYNSNTSTINPEKTEVNTPEKTNATTAETNSAIDGETMQRIATEPSLDKKLTLAVENFLETHDPEYAKIEDPEEKQHYLNNKLGVLIAYCNNEEEFDKKFQEFIDNKKNTGKKRKRVEQYTEEELNALKEKFKETEIITKCFSALQILHDENKSIEEITNIDRTEFETKSIKTTNLMIKNGYEYICKNNPDLDKKERINIFLDSIYSLQSEEYSKLGSLEEKQAYIETQKQKAIAQFHHQDSWDKLTEEQKKFGEEVYLNTIEKLIKECPEDKTFVEHSREVKKSDMCDTLVESYITELKNTTEPQKRSALEEKIEIAQEMQKIYELFENKELTYHKKIEQLKNKLNNGEFKTEAARHQAEMLVAKSTIRPGHHCHHEDLGTNAEHMGVKSFTKESFINHIQEFKKTHNEKETKEEFEHMVIRAYNNPDPEVRDSELKIIKECFLEQGFTEQEIDELFKSIQVQHAKAANAACHNDHHEYTNVMNDLEIAVENANTPEEKAQYEELITGMITNSSSNYVLGDDPKALKDFGKGIQNNPGYTDNFNAGLHEHQDKGYIKDLYKSMSQDEGYSKQGLANMTESLIQTAHGDQDRVEYADALSKMGNAAMLEGIAAGADSVQDKNYRTQYNSVVTQAAQNYPPEVQQTIQTVLSTGEISQGTRTSTEPATNSYYASADTYSDSTSNKSYTSTYTNNNNYSKQTTTYNTGVDYVTTPARSSSNLDITQTIIENSLNTNTQINKTQQTSQQVDIPKIKEQAIQNQAEANQKMKDIALENVAEVKAKIDESIAEWELKQELKLSEEIIAEMKEIAASEALEEYIEANPSEKEKVLAKLSNANSISEVYDILLSALGSKVHQKFIENLARGGSSGNIRAFINSKAGNTDVIKQILLRTTSTTLKNELIGMLPPSDVLELLDKNLITTLDNVDHEIIFTYVSKNIYSMTQTNFANYLKYLPFDEREKLIAMRNKAYGVKSEAQQVSIETEQAEVQTNPIVQSHNQASLTQDNNQNLTTHKSTPSAQPKNNKTKNSDSKEFVENPQTKFKAGETTKVLNDGRVITSQGTSFAGISNNTSNEEGYRIVDAKTDKKAKEGAPIGMNDEILVPGSQEWLMKYNKQAPKTAFTIAALEDDNQEDGLNFGSNKVKFGQPIKKKYNPNNFNIRG